MPSVFEESKAYRPFMYDWAMEMSIEHAQDLYWDTHEIEMIDDVRQYHAEGGLATPNISHEVTKNMLDNVLAIFTQMDIEAGGLYCKLLPFVKNNEIRNMWLNFGCRESTHQRAYAKGVEVLDMPESTWTSFMDYEATQAKIDLMSNIDGRDLSNKLDFAKTVAQLLLAEGICLFGAFACMLNLKRYGLMMGLNLINEWSLRDEQRHVEGNIRVLNEVRKELTKAENEELDAFICRLTVQYVEAEELFIELVFEMGGVEDMTKYDMFKYIAYLADLRLTQLNLEPIYGVTENPLVWMDYVLGGAQHTNFFEAKVSEYSHSGLSGEPVDRSKYKKKAVK